MYSLCDRCSHISRWQIECVPANRNIIYPRHQLLQCLRGSRGTRQDRRQTVVVNTGSLHEVFRIIAVLRTCGGPWTRYCTPFSRRNVQTIIGSKAIVWSFVSQLAQLGCINIWMMVAIVPRKHTRCDPDRTAVTGWSCQWIRFKIPIA